MNTKILILAVAVVAAFAVNGRTGSNTPEDLKVAHEEVFTGPSSAIAVRLGAGAENLSCAASLRRRGSGYHNRCPRGSVMTGLQPINDSVITVTCASVVVTCTQKTTP